MEEYIKDSAWFASWLARHQSRNDSNRTHWYIDLYLKGTTDLNDREREIKISDLLHTIQPTVENQQSDDENDVERSVSTILSYVKDTYKLTELRVHIMRYIIIGIVMRYNKTS